MVAVVHKNKTPVADILLKIRSLGRGELNQLMTTQIAKGALEDFVAAEGNDVFNCIYRKRCILNQGIEEVRGHTLVYVPVTRLILQSRKKELFAVHHPVRLLFNAC